MSNKLRGLAVTGLMFAAALTVQLSTATAAKADGVSVSASAKSVSGNKCRVSARLKAQLGPFSADLRFGPVYLQKPTGPKPGCRTYYRRMGPVGFKITVCVHRNRVSVRVTAYAQVGPRKVTLTEYKSVRID